MLFWGKIFCFGVSERHGVRLRMLLCDNSLKRAAGCHRRSLIGPDSDKGVDRANTQIAVPHTFFWCVCVCEGRGWGVTGTAAFDTNTHTKCTVAANKEQMNNKTNHTVNTLRQGTLTIYHKSASGEKQNSSAVRCKTERETDRKRETDTEKETWVCTP